MQVNTRQSSVLPIIGPDNQPKQSQLQFPRPAQMSLFARLSCYPPLGQLTCPRRVQKALRSEADDTVSFVVLVEVYSVGIDTMHWFYNILGFTRLDAPCALQ